MPPWTQRHNIATRRLHNILSRHIVASDRILEQKISDAGPTNQRIDPHILTEARQQLRKQGQIIPILRGNVPWYHLSTADPKTVQSRLATLVPIHRQTTASSFTTRLGQTLEIAVYRGLLSQNQLEFFGSFADLDDHDDSTSYSKEEPPSTLSGRRIPNARKLDFLVRHPNSGYAGIEVKNIRTWLYPSREEIADLIDKCCSLDVVPVLIARRIHYSTFTVLGPCGIILHQNFNQLYPASDSTLAEQVRRKDLLGYHDVRVGNEPDARLIKFLHQNLPNLLPSARNSFDDFKDLLSDYANGMLTYESFAARVRRRSQGLSEDSDDFDPDPGDFGF